MIERSGTVSVQLLQAQAQRLQERVHGLERDTDQQRRALQQITETAQAGAQLIREFYLHSELRDSFAALRQYLRTFYDAHYSALYLFTSQTLPRVNADLYIKSPNHAARRSFLALFEHNMPLCDSLQDEHLHLLLGSLRNQVQATVLIPVRYPQSDALLVLGSQIQDRYRRGLALDFLVGLNEAIVAISHLRLALG